METGIKVTHIMQSNSGQCLPVSAPTSKLWKGHARGGGAKENYWEKHRKIYAQTGQKKKLC